MYRNRSERERTVQERRELINEEKRQQWKTMQIINPAL